MTNTFKVTYANGSVQEITSDDATVEAFCNSHFGSTWPEAEEHGATVEMEEFVPPPTLEQAWGINAPKAPAEEPEATSEAQTAADTEQPTHAAE